MSIRRSRRTLTTTDLALVREALAAAGLDPTIADGAANGADLWARAGLGTDAARVLRQVVLPPPPRQPGATVNVTLTIPADLADAYASAGTYLPSRATLLQRAMAAELAARGIEPPPLPPEPPARVQAAVAARAERRERSRR